MNILPKKSWHVRTKRNIERIRRDEEEARLEEELAKKRRLIAEQEARFETLKRRAGIPDGKEESSDSESKLKSTLDHLMFKNSEHESGSKRNELLWQSKISLSNRLVNPKDTTNPWYCKDTLTRLHKADNLQQPSCSSFNLSSSAPIHNQDPLLKMQVAQDIIKINEKNRKGDPKEIEVRDNLHRNNRRDMVSNTETGRGDQVYRRQSYLYKSETISKNLKSSEIANERKNYKERMKQEYERDGHRKHRCKDHKKHDRKQQESQKVKIS